MKHTLIEYSFLSFLQNEYILIINNYCRANVNSKCNNYHPLSRFYLSGIPDK